MTQSKEPELPEFVEVIMPELDMTQFAVAVAVGIGVGLFAFYMWQEYQKEHPQPIRYVDTDDGDDNELPRERVIVNPNVPGWAQEG